MNAAEAKKLYEKNWCRDFNTIEALYTQIKTLAENGAYEMCIYVGINDKYHEVKGLLSDNGYSVKDYNGGGNGILEITFT